jgi:hypothetical protein
VDDLHVFDPLPWGSPEHAFVLSDNAVETAVSAPLTPLPTLWAAPLSPRWPLYQAIASQGGSDAHQSEYHCLCLLAQHEQQRQPLPMLPLPL